LNITIRKSGDFTILDVTSAFKIGGPEQAFRDQVDRLLEGGALNLAVNLSGVTFLDSSGIGSVARCHKIIKGRNGRLHFFGAPKMVRQTLKMVSLDKVMSIFEDEARAMASCQPFRAFLRKGKASAPAKCALRQLTDETDSSLFWGRISRRSSSGQSARPGPRRRKSRRGAGPGSQPNWSWKRRRVPGR